MNPRRWQEVRRLFLSLLDSPLDRRSTILQRMESGDSTLLDTVVSLLEAEERALSEGFLVTSFLQPDVVLDTLPEKVGPYQILELIGRGGMGVVYRARDPALRRDIAIKMLPSELSENEWFRVNCFVMVLTHGMT
jgi:serine/threonine protein kinase